MPREWQDTRLESVGAEFLVLGHLLLHRIVAHKTYTNYPGYDLVAVEPSNNSSARIQVKSRWRTGAPGFLINNFSCDFVILACLNRGSKDGRKPVRPPDFYVFPTGVVKSALRTKGWSKVYLRDITELDQYRDNWNLVREFLRADSQPTI